MPNNNCKTGIIVANENKDNIVDNTLNNIFNATYHLYGGKNLRRTENIINELDYTILGMFQFTNILIYI